MSNKEGEGRPFIRTDTPLTKENFKECLISAVCEYEINEDVEEMAGAMIHGERIEEGRRDRARPWDEKIINEIKKTGGFLLTKADIEAIQAGETEDRLKIKKAFDMLEKHRPDIFKNIAGVKNIRYNDDGTLCLFFKRLKAGYCKTHNRTHTADNCDTVFITKSGKCFYMCAKQPTGELYPLFKIKKEERQKEYIEKWTEKKEQLKKQYNRRIYKYV